MTDGDKYMKDFYNGDPLEWKEGAKEGLRDLCENCKEANAKGIPHESPYNCLFDPEGSGNMCGCSVCGNDSYEPNEYQIMQRQFGSDGGSEISDLQYESKSTESDEEENYDQRDESELEGGSYDDGASSNPDNWYKTEDGQWKVVGDEPYEGESKASESSIECPMCEGIGQIFDPIDEQKDFQTINGKVCPRCNGEGTISDWDRNDPETGEPVPVGYSWTPDGAVKNESKENENTDFNNQQVIDFTTINEDEIATCDLCGKTWDMNDGSDIDDIETHLSLVHDKAFESKANEWLDSSYQDELLYSKYYKELQLAQNMIRDGNTNPSDPKMGRPIFKHNIADYLWNTLGLDGVPSDKLDEIINNLYKLEGKVAESNATEDFIDDDDDIDEETGLYKIDDDKEKDEFGNDFVQGFDVESRASEQYTPDTKLYWDEEGTGSIMSEREWGDKFTDKLTYVGLAKDNGYDFKYDSAVQNWEQIDYHGESSDEDKKTIDKLLKKKGKVTFDDFLAQYGDYPDGEVEESFGDCGCKMTNKAKETWEGLTDSDKQLELRGMEVDEGYAYYPFEHLPKKIGEAFVDKFNMKLNGDSLGWNKIPALERAQTLRKIGFTPRDSELVANLEYQQLSESLKKDVDEALNYKVKTQESQVPKENALEKFEDGLYSNMYDGYLERRGARVDSKKKEQILENNNYGLDISKVKGVESRASEKAGGWCNTCAKTDKGGWSYANKTYHMQTYHPEVPRKDWNSLDYFGSAVSGDDNYIGDEEAKKYYERGGITESKANEKITTRFENGIVYHTSELGGTIKHPEDVWCGSCDNINESKANEFEDDWIDEYFEFESWIENGEFYGYLRICKLCGMKHESALIGEQREHLINKHGFSLNELEGKIPTYESKASEKMWECFNCDGTGKDWMGYSCYHCKGTGQLSEEDMERQYQSDQKWKKMASPDDDYIDGSDVPTSGFYESLSKADEDWHGDPEQKRRECGNCGGMRSDYNKPCPHCGAPAHESKATEDMKWWECEDCKFFGKTEDETNKHELETGHTTYGAGMTSAFPVNDGLGLLKSKKTESKASEIRGIDEMRAWWDQASISQREDVLALVGAERSWATFSRSDMPPEVANKILNGYFEFPTERHQHGDGGQWDKQGDSWHAKSVPIGNKKWLEDRYDGDDWITPTWTGSKASEMGSYIDLQMRAEDKWREMDEQERYLALREAGLYETDGSTDDLVNEHNIFAYLNQQMGSEFIKRDLYDYIIDQFDLMEADESKSNEKNPYYFDGYDDEGYYIGTAEDVKNDLYDMTSHNYNDSDWEKYRNLIMMEIVKTENSSGFSHDAIDSFLRRSGATSEDLIYDLAMQYGKSGGKTSVESNWNLWESIMRNPNTKEVITCPSCNSVDITDAENVHAMTEDQPDYLVCNNCGASFDEDYGLISSGENIQDVLGSHGVYISDNEEDYLDIGTPEESEEFDWKEDVDSMNRQELEDHIHISLPDEEYDYAVALLESKFGNANEEFLEDDLGDEFEGEGFEEDDHKRTSSGQFTSDLPEEKNEPYGKNPYRGKVDIPFTESKSKAEEAYNKGASAEEIYSLVDDKGTGDDRSESEEEYLNNLYNKTNANKGAGFSDLQ